MASWPRTPAPHTICHECRRMAAGITGRARRSGVYGTPSEEYPWHWYCHECLVDLLRGIYPSVDFEFDEAAQLAIIMEE